MVVVEARPFDVVFLDENMPGLNGIETLQRIKDKHPDVPVIMITKSEVVKLADMGLARAMADKDVAEAEKGKAFGTPYYISPEQIRGRIDIGPSADIYGLGATAYHMVTGHVPFTGKNPNEVMQRHLRTPLTPPDQANPNLSANFCQVLEMMMV